MIATTWAELQSAVPGSLGGWMTESERDKLFEIASAMQPGQRFMEIGVYGGTTLSLFALLSPDSCEVIGMDSWENDTPNRDPETGQPVDLRTFCVRNLERNGVADRVRLIDGSSHIHGPTWATPLDVLIIDGDHTYGGAKQDLIEFAKAVVPGGLLIMDDYWGDPQVHRATDEWYAAEPEGRWTLEWGGEGRGPWIPYGQGWIVPIGPDGNQLSKMLVYRRGAA